MIAFKNKQSTAKTVLSVIKDEIQTQEKKDNVQHLSDENVLKIKTTIIVATVISLIILYFVILFNYPNQAMILAMPIIIMPVAVALFHVTQQYLRDKELNKYKK